jgi:hypothetical protein
MTLQIVIKVINGSTRPNSIILILLVFGAYPRIADSLLLSFIIIKRTKAIRKTTKEIRFFYVERYMADALQ